MNKTRNEPEGYTPSVAIVDRVLVDDVVIVVVIIVIGGGGEVDFVHGGPEERLAV